MSDVASLCLLSGVSAKAWLPSDGFNALECLNSSSPLRTTHSLALQSLRAWNESVFLLDSIDGIEAANFAWLRSSFSGGLVSSSVTEVHHRFHQHHLKDTGNSEPV
jgi:hypothetical protein